MSWCRCIIEVANDLFDFIGGDSVVVGGLVVVSFYTLWWEGWSGFCLWWEESVLKDVAFSLEVIYAI
jgi:hypothetical protein